MFLKKKSKETSRFDKYIARVYCKEEFKVTYGYCERATISDLHAGVI